MSTVTLIIIAVVAAVLLELVTAWQIASMEKRINERMEREIYRAGRAAEISDNRMDAKIMIDLGYKYDYGLDKWVKVNLGKTPQGD
jgi:hypothetical protein